MQHLKHEQGIHTWHSHFSSQTFSFQEVNPRWQWNSSKCISVPIYSLPCCHVLVFFSIFCSLTNILKKFTTPIASSNTRHLPSLRVHISLVVALHISCCADISNTCYRYDISVSPRISLQLAALTGTYIYISPSSSLTSNLMLPHPRRGSNMSSIGLFIFFSSHLLQNCKTKPSPTLSILHFIFLSQPIFKWYVSVPCDAALSLFFPRSKAEVQSLSHYSSFH